MNTINKNSFYILTPRIISYFLMRVVIFDKIKKKFFIQYVRNFYDINTVFQIFGYEEYNLKKIKLWNKLINEYKNIKANKLIVDCGSNIGSTSRYFSELFPKAKIISIEPDTQNFNLAKKNSNSEKISLLKNAVASSNFSYEVKSQLDPRAHKIKFNKKNKKNKTITIMQLLEKNNFKFLNKKNLIKNYEFDKKNNFHLVSKSDYWSRIYFLLKWTQINKKLFYDVKF